MSEDTPTTEEVRDALRPYRIHPLEFDRWLTEVKAEECARLITQVSEPIENAIGLAEFWDWIPERGDILAELNAARDILNLKEPA